MLGSQEYKFSLATELELRRMPQKPEMNVWAASGPLSRFDHVYIQFSIAGGVEDTRGILGAASDEHRSVLEPDRI